jgi:hypothetical protein
LFKAHQQNRDMKEETWNLVKTAIESVCDAPHWLKEFASVQYSEISRLHEFEEAADGEVARPHLEEQLVRQDYLEFLKEQIQLNARGAEWTALLQRRLDALRPFVGKNVQVVTIYRKPEVVRLRIDSRTGRVFHFELN